jgi:hypothetical protein
MYDSISCLPCINVVFPKVAPKPTLSNAYTYILIRVLSASHKHGAQKRDDAAPPIFGQSNMDMTLYTVLKMNVSLFFSSRFPLLLPSEMRRGPLSQSLS